MSATPPNIEDYSPSATIISFETPLPLLRQPIPAAIPDDPSLGPFLLAFKDPQTWASTFNSCHSQIIQQCEAGARVGCSIAASNKCKPPWWKTLIGLSNSDFKEREVCEEQEMEICFQDSKVKCFNFAKDKCFPVFRDARISINYRNVNARNVGKMISLATIMDNNNKSKGYEFLRSQFEVTNFRGSELLGDHLNLDIYH